MLPSEGSSTALNIDGPLAAALSSLMRDIFPRLAPGICVRRGGESNDG